MALEIVKLYISQLSEIFELSEVSIMTSAGTSFGQPPRFPENSHSICSAYYLQKITNDIQDAVNELVLLDIARDTGLKGFLESVRWRFVAVLITAWHRGWFTTIAYCGMIISLIDFIDAKMHHSLESWLSKPSETSTTHYPVQIEVYQRHMTTATFKLANGGEPTSSSLSLKPSRQNVLAPVWITKISKAFLDALCTILDGMFLLASKDPSTDGEQPSNAIVEDLNYVQKFDPSDSVCP